MTHWRILWHVSSHAWLAVQINHINDNINVGVAYVQEVCFPCSDEASPDLSHSPLGHPHSTFDLGSW